MTVYPYLHTIDLAQAGHISVQQVRNYEASGSYHQPSAALAAIASTRRSTS